ncbi:MAG: response regulator [Bacteroidota bacterium]|nr:response regulator [Bacteroidota bacterium]
MKKKKILIIDDFEPLLDEIVEFLEFEGFQVSAAVNGSEGVQKALENPPDLVLCDIAMPKMDGYDVLESFNKIPHLATIPFVFLTAKAQVEDFKKGLQLGVDDYITKPVEMDRLIMTIHQRLEKNKKISEKNKEQFNAMISNPQIGVFVFSGTKFLIVNERLQELTGYSKSNLNAVDFAEIIIGDSEKILAKLKNCLNGIYEQFQTKFSVLDSNKKSLFLELFVRHILIDGNKALIGSIVEYDVSASKNTSRNVHIKSENEFKEITDYLISLGKDNIVSELNNVRDLLDFKKEQKLSSVRKKVKLSKRETEVLELICKGFTNAEIGEKLFISKRTVDNHRARILNKTEAGNTATLVAYAIKNNLVKL